MKKSFRSFMNIVNKINLRMAINHCCRDCKYFDNDSVCEHCDIENNDLFEPIEGGEDYDNT